MKKYILGIFLSLCIFSFSFAQNSYNPNATPTITISGPTVLNTNTRYIWNFTIENSIFGRYFYKVNFGDTLIDETKRNWFGFSRKMKQSLFHIYREPGNYNIVAQILTPRGTVATQTLSVVVTNPLVLTNSSTTASINGTSTTSATDLYNGSCQIPKSGLFVVNGTRVEYSNFLDNQQNIDGLITPSFICQSGTWLQCDVNGQNCQTYRYNFTPANTVKACTTPWGNRVVQDGDAIVNEPYFTNGIYSRLVIIPMKRCSNGTWLTCDFAGSNCQN